MEKPDEAVEFYYEFARFRLLPSERTLLCDEEPVPLTPKAFDTLVFLVENSGHLIEKDEFLEKIWAEAFVEEATLARTISVLRKVLGENAEGRKFIETVSKRGYRFVEPVKRLSSDPKPEPPQTSPAPTENVSTPQVKPISEKEKSARTRRLLLWSLLIIGIAGGLFSSLSFWNAQPSREEQLSRIRAIAVLPFKPIGGQEQQRDESLELGMADALITRLSRVKHIVVRPTTAVAKYQGQSPSAAQAGEELLVEAVLSGSLQRQGERVRVNAQLINTADGTPLWGETFDAKFTDIFDVQDSISEQVVSALTVQLSGAERQLITKHSTTNPEAYQLYMKGRYFWNKRAEAERRKAIEYFEQAIAIDPNYAQAYAGLADCYLLGGRGTGMSLDEIMSNAKNAAAKALEIDNSLAEAHTSLAAVKLTYDWDFPAAAKGLEHSLQLNSNYAPTHQWYMEYLFTQERYLDAIAAIKRAQELDPTSLIIHRDVGRAYYYARQPDEAIEQYRKTLEMDGSFHPAMYYLSLAYAQKGLSTEAVAEMEKVSQFTHGAALTKATLVYLLANHGRQNEANKLLDELNQTAQQRPVPPFDLAIAYTGLKDNDKAFELLEKACAGRSYRLIWLKADPIFDSLRSDSRFQKLLDCIRAN